jgi:dethiobiotin synthetase
MTAERRRPPCLVLVTGTGTEVGKTWVAAQLARDLRGAGLRVAARKPAQSFDAGARRTDAHVLAEATGETPAVVCPEHRWYGVPMAPPMAAEVLGRPPFTIADLVHEIRWPEPAPTVGLVESAGGVRSPLAVDGDSVSLAEAVRPDLIVVVAHAGLGTISDVRLAADALGRTGDRARSLVLLNRYDEGVDLHRRNRDWLGRRDRIDVAVSSAELAQRVRARVLGTSEA